MKTKSTKTFAELTATLANRKSANVKAAASVSAAPEKDPSEKGTVTIPANTLDHSNTPAGQKNQDATSTLTPPAVGRTVEGQEAASIQMKIANTVAKVSALFKKADKAEAPVAAAEAGKKLDCKDPADKGTVEAKTGPVVAGEPKGDETNTDLKKDAAAAELDATYLAKLASVILATEDGRNFAEAKLKESFGAEAASDIIKAACVMEQAAQEADMAAQEEQAYLQSGAYQAEQMWKSASDAERAEMTRMAKIHSFEMSKYGESEFGEILKSAYDQGAQAAASEMDAAPMPPEGGAEAAPEAGAGQEGGEASLEEVIEVLGQMVQSGEVSPEVAQEILSKITGETGAEAGSPGGTEGAEAAEAQAEPEVAEMAEKGASISAKLLV